MREFLVRLGVFLAIQTVIAAVVLRNAAEKPNFGYMAAFEDKNRLLAAHDRPHVILIGGSNVAFGFDSAQLQREMGMPVINVGLHASLGLEFFLSVAEKHVRPGDIIVLAPEWYMLLAPHDSKTEFVEQLLRQSPSAWQFMLPGSAREWKGFFDETALPEAARLVQAGMELYSSEDIERAKKDTQPHLYTRLSFNEFGDVVGHHHRAPPEKIDDLETTRLDFNPAQFQSACRLINDWADRCQRAGAAVYFAYGPIPAPVFERMATGISNGHRHLECHLDIPILHPPASVRYPVDFFFDTVSHLNQHGKSRRTAMVAEALRKQSETASGSEAVWR